MKNLWLLVAVVLLSGCASVLSISPSEKFKHDIEKQISSEKKAVSIQNIESNIKNIKPKKASVVKIKNVLIEDLIAVIFGEVLKYPYIIDRSIDNLERRVDVEINNPGKVQNLFPVMVAMLEGFGLDVQDVEGVILFTLKDSKQRTGKNGKLSQDSDLKDVNVKENTKSVPSNCVFTFKPIHTKAEDIKTIIEKVLINDQSKVIVSGQNNQLIIRSTEKEKRMLVKLLRTLDEKRKQVSVDLTIAEVTLTGDLSVGLQGFLKNNSVDFKLGVNIDNGFGITGAILSGDLFKTVLQIGEKRGLIKIMANPYMMISDGSESSIEIGSEYPILKAEQAVAAVAGSSTPTMIQSVEYRKTGIILNIKPIIAGSSVHLVAGFEMSEGQKNTISSINSPAILSRKLKVNVVLLSDQSLIVGGLVNESKVKDDYSILKYVPYGLSRVSSRSEIVVIAKIKIIENEDFSKWFDDLQKKYESQNIEVKK